MANASPELPKEDQADINPDFLDVRRKEFAGDHKAAGDPSDPRGDDSKGGDDSADSKKSNNLEGYGGVGGIGGAGQGYIDLKKAESGYGGLYNPNDKSGQFGIGGGLLGAIKRRRKRLLIAGAATGGIAGIIISIFMALVPLKIEHIITNLQRRFFATTENVTEKEGQRLLRRYLRKALPSYKHCKGGTVNKSCFYRVDGGEGGPVDKLFKSWSDARIEQRLADNGIEFQYKNNSLYMKGPGTPKDGDLISTKDSDIDTGLDREFKKTSRQELRAAFKDSIRKETGWRKVFHRYKAGRLLEKKYGVKRCLLFCGTRDALADSIDAQKKAAKIYLVNRVIDFHDTAMLQALSCYLEDCDPTDRQANNPDDPAAKETGGEPTSATEAETRKIAGEAASHLAEHELTELEKHALELEEKGPMQAVMESILKTFFSEGTSKTTAAALSKAIPIVGWIDLIARLVNAADGASMALRALSYMVVAGDAVRVYGTYSTYSDEIHTGHVTSTEVGSWSNSLSAVDKNDKTKDLLGGTASAEQTPLYNSVIDGKNGNSSSYKCADGKTVPSGQLVCNEERLDQGNATANSIHDVLNSCPALGDSAPESSMQSLQLIAGGGCPKGLLLLAKVWKYTIGKIFDGFNWVVGKGLELALKPLDAACKAGIAVDPITSGYCLMKEEIKVLMPTIFRLFSNYLIPNPFGSFMSGGRTFDGIAMGAAVSGHDTCNQIGCKTISPKKAALITNEQLGEEKKIFENKPVFARMFDTSSDYSLVSRVAVGMPTNVTSFTNNFSSMISSPLGIIRGVFGSVFLNKSVFAADTASIDPFGIGSVGYDDSEIPDQPDVYWKEHNCGDDSENGPIAKWQKEAEHTKNENTGQVVHKTVEPCLLILHTVGDFGAKYDTSLLTEDEQEDLDSTSSSDSTGTAGVEIDMANLYKDSSSIQCATGTSDAGVQDGYHGGKKVSIRTCSVSNLSGAVVNSRVSGAIYALAAAAKKDHVSLSASSSFRTMAEQQSLWISKGQNTSVVARPGYSNHQMGLAIDFGGLDQHQHTGPIWDWLEKNAGGFGYKNYENEAWHWSPDGK